MRILIAPDSFKESLPAKEAARAIQSGFQKVFPTAIYDLLPVGDGGEGTVDAIVESLGLQYQMTEVSDAFGKKKVVRYAKNQDTAFFEVAEIAGLESIPLDKRHPLELSTRGTGELINYLINEGFKKIVIGVGGTSTNDGGIGMAAGLGYEFFDKNNEPIVPIGKNLDKVASFNKEKVSENLAKVEIIVITDVTNHLCGEEGASAVFGPQKGLKKEEVIQADKALGSFYGLISPEVLQLPGGGAGGGMSAGLSVFAHGKIVSGIKYVLDLLNFDEYAREADLVIIGEGKMDGQSLKGKAPIGIAERVPNETPVIALCGILGDQSEKLHEYGIDAIFPIIPRLDSLEELYNQAKPNLTRTSQNIAMLLKATTFRGEDL